LQLLSIGALEERDIQMSSAVQIVKEKSLGDEVHGESVLGKGFMDVRIGQLTDSEDSIYVRNYAVNTPFQKDDLCPLCLDSLASDTFVCQLGCGHDLHLGCCYQLKANASTRSTAPTCIVCKQEVSYDKDDIAHYASMGFLIRATPQFDIVETLMLPEGITGIMACEIGFSTYPNLYPHCKRPYICGMLATKRFHTNMAHSVVLPEDED
jgi:hypothetical protein